MSWFYIFAACFASSALSVAYMTWHQAWAVRALEVSVRKYIAAQMALDEQTAERLTRLEVAEIKRAFAEGQVEIDTSREAAKRWEASS